MGDEAKQWVMKKKLAPFESSQLRGCLRMAMEDHR